jgi:hypothetical protein
MPPFLVAWPGRALFFPLHPRSIPPYPEAYTPAVCLGTLMWLG